MGLRNLLISILLCASISGVARDLTTEEKLADFHYFTSVINSGYGPLEYKALNKVVLYPQLNARFEQEIAATTTNNDFYYKLLEYVATYRDGHFNISVPTTKTATIAVVTDLIDGKVLITKIGRDKLTEDKFPFNVGDEVVSVDNQPVAAFLDFASKYIASGRTETVRQIASWVVFSRKAARIPLPAGKTLKVQIRRGTSNLIEDAELEWDFKGTDIEVTTPSMLQPLSVSGSVASLNYDLLDNEMVKDFVHPYADSTFICSGDTRIEIPKDATVIMKTPFVAYYHPTAKGNVGYLRIPHYMPQPAPGKNAIEAVLTWNSQYEFAVRELEKNTVGLIIDQDHNCGGSISVVNTMISMFMDHPFTPSQFELLGTRESYLGFEKWVNETTEFTLDREGVTRVLNLVKDTWIKGTSYLTPKTSIDGVQTILPNSIHYTKPIVMLIDEMAGSGGDMFPAMMKGLGRAKLFGQNTSGLGGHVQDYPSSLPNSQLHFRITKSLFYRPDGVAVENNGASPDQLYTITRDDILYGFKGYQREYLSYLLSFLP